MHAILVLFYQFHLFRFSDIIPLDCLKCNVEIPLIVSITHGFFCESITPCSYIHTHGNSDEPGRVATPPHPVLPVHLLVNKDLYTIYSPNQSICKLQLIDHCDLRYENSDDQLLKTTLKPWIHRQPSSCVSLLISSFFVSILTFIFPSVQGICYAVGFPEAKVIILYQDDFHESNLLYIL